MAEFEEEKKTANSTGFVQKNQMLPIKLARMSTFVVSIKFGFSEKAT